METRIYLRLQAWERAKGELQAVLQTYADPDPKHQYEKLSENICSFIEFVEEQDVGIG